MPSVSHPRPPRRTDYPDCSPRATFAPRPAPPAPAPPAEARTGAEVLRAGAIAIRARVYAIERCAIDPRAREVEALYALTSDAGEVYHVCQVRGAGHRCTCADWEFRRAGIDPAGCKHCRALAAVGLLDPVAAVLGRGRVLVPGRDRLPDEFDTPGEAG